MFADVQSAPEANSSESPGRNGARLQQQVELVVEMADKLPRTRQKFHAISIIARMPADVLRDKPWGRIEGRELEDYVRPLYDH